MADEMKVIVKARELAVHSFKLTSNSNRFPKKYRHSLADRIQIKSLDVYETLFEANQLVRDLRNSHDLCGNYFTYASFKYTKECPKWPKKEVNHG